jgi:5-methylcytosine-specific restriction protein A
MPRTCATHACPVLVANGHCAAHRAHRDVRPRESSHKRGYNTLWRAFRADWLREFPFCGDRPGAPTVWSQCHALGYTHLATDVDHIVRISGPDDPRFYDRANLQSLCHACHSAKTKREQIDRGGVKTLTRARPQTAARSDFAGYEFGSAPWQA